MGIFKKGEVLGSGTTPGRYKIRITTEDGETLYWNKRGGIHIVDEDVAQIFVANFKPELFQVLPDGSLTPPSPGRTKQIVKVEMEPE
ncbi:MAG: hypothetical protein VYD81_00290 [Planctomycetota bacterium]|nr:hypothetical protein [Planctomycetota bacterium]|tara:strand:+ start:371 stop:631 length:261 start_codon:yes stop_codon:yes gene_type:complete